MFAFRTLCYRAATVLALATTVACSSSGKDDPDPTAARGMAWTADGSNLTTTTLQLQNNLDVLSISGAVTNGTTTSIVALEVPAAVGTYTFSPTSTASAVYSVTTATTADVYYAGPTPTGGGTVTGAGTIQVTAFTGAEVKGTFTFTGIDANTGASKSVTSGTFTVGL